MRYTFLVVGSSLPSLEIYRAIPFWLVEFLLRNQQITLWEFPCMLSGERILFGSVSSQQRFGVTDIKALGASQLLGLGPTVLYLSDKSVLQLYFI